MDAINEQELYAYREFGSELMDNMPLHSGSGVAIRHEVDVEMLEMPAYKSDWLGDTMERAIFKETYKAMLPYTELGYKTLGLPPVALDPSYSFMYSDEEKAIARTEFEAQQVVQRSRAEKFESAFGDYRRDKQGLVRREVNLDEDLYGEGNPDDMDQKISEPPDTRGGVEAPPQRCRVGEGVL